MFVKICGITDVKQGSEIASALLAAQGANNCALGFICYPPSKRYIPPKHIREIVATIPAGVQTIGVFVNESTEKIVDCVAVAALSGVQLHGTESPEYCAQLRQELTNVRILKALRLKEPEDLASLKPLKPYVDAFLIDAYHPDQMGGTGETVDWSWLKSFTPGLPWLLAGGLTPENVKEAIMLVKPDGIDLSSGVEISPGNKDLNQVHQLLQELSILSRG